MTGESGLEQPQTLPGFEPQLDSALARIDGGLESDRAAQSPLDLAFPPAQANAIRVEIDDRSSAIVRRLELWRDEFVAWIKTLASAAVYATLIVT
ncbi:MAG: hypothetical protein ACRD2A_16615, partial [Vicinamibacterales bacterium]